MAASVFAIYAIIAVPIGFATHFIVWNRPLNNRPGWDISALDAKQLQRCYLHLKDEQNKPWNTALSNLRMSSRK